MNTTNRPRSVSAVAWIIIVLGGMKIVLAPLGFTVAKVQKALEASGMALNTAVLWQIVLGVIFVISGAAILKRLNWGRLLYLCAVPVSLLSTWFFYKFAPRDIMAVVIYIVFLTLLISPSASKFFAQKR